MALKLTKTTAEGFSIEYWRIDPRMSVDLTTGSKNVRATVQAFVSASTRQANKSPVRLSRDVDGVQVVTSVTLNDAETTSALATGDPRAAMYAKLKALEFFAGATDC